MNERQLLEKALDILEGGEKWTKGAFRDRSDTTVKYCSVGALRKAIGSPLDNYDTDVVMNPLYMSAVDRLYDAIGMERPYHYAEGDIYLYNDQASWEDIVLMYKRAIEG